MAKDTKSRLLEAALEMFARNGYVGTNIRELSASLGLGKSSLYRHFESKEDVWNALLDEMHAYYEQHFGSPDNLPPIPQSTEELTAQTLRMLDFTLHDKKIMLSRKLLLTEQFRNERARRLATAHFNTGLEALFTKLFEGMMANGSLKRNDPAMLAFAYIAPISALVQLCDREPERESEVVEKIKAFLAHFTEHYGTGKSEEYDLSEAE